MDDPKLEPGEEIAARQPGVGIATYRSGINYRVVPRLPLLQDVGFYVTSRRAILRGELFMNLYDKDVSFWFPGEAPAAGDETVVSVTLEHGDVLGDSLLISTRAEREHFLRAKDARFEIFTSQAKALLEHFPRGVRGG